MNLCSLSKAQGATALACVLAVVGIVLALIGVSGLAGVALSSATVALLAYAVWCQQRTAVAVDEVADDIAEIGA